MNCKVKSKESLGVIQKSGKYPFPIYFRSGLIEIEVLINTSIQRNYICINNKNNSNQ